LTEQELIQGCRANRQEFQKALFDLYAGKMMALCNRYTSDRHLAQDMLQEGFIRVFKYIHQFRGDGSFEGWMRRIFASVAVRELKRNKVSFSDIDTAILTEPHVDPDVVSRMTEDEIHELIRSMPVGYRTVFNLHVIEGYSHEEIAKIMNIQASTSRVQLMKAKQFMKALIANIKKTNKAWATFLI